MIREEATEPMTSEQWMCGSVTLVAAAARAMRRATELARQCDLFLAIGSSLVVWPAAGFPLMAKNCGAKLVIINNEPTEQDDIADLVIRYDIGETLGPFVGN